MLTIEEILMAPISSFALIVGKSFVQEVSGGSITKFSRKSDLVRHKEASLNSDGLPNHACEECEESFCTGKQVKAHYNSKHREFKCLHCEEVFSTKQRLMTHQRRRRFCCSVCGKKFCSKKKFEMHVHGSSSIV